MGDDEEREALVRVYFSDDGFSEEETKLVLEYLSAVYRELGGTGLEVINPTLPSRSP